MKKITPRYCLFLLSLMLIATNQPLFCNEETSLPRKVAAIYVGKQYEAQWFSKVLQYSAMPIEYNGFVMEYHNMIKGFPDIKNRPDILGAIIWDLYDIDKKQQIEYLDWAVDMIEAGKKIVLLETLPGDFDNPDREQQNKINRFWSKMGVSNEGWQTPTLRIQYPLKDPILTDFERQYIDIKSSYPQLKVISNEVTPHLIARQNYDIDTDSCLIFTGPNGSFSASSFTFYENFYGGRDFVKWYINPFLFFNLALDGAKMPKPDISTLAGRRIYYSQIDGDGWSSISKIEEYEKQKMITAKVILKEIIEPNPDLPVTVAAIAANLDPKWVGVPKAREAAKDIYKVDHVEMSSHTYSHPFEWGFFQHYSEKEEEPFLRFYKFGTWKNKNLFENISIQMEESEGERGDITKSDLSYPHKLNMGYTIPRAYANEPFNLKQEIEGSLKYIDQFSPNKEKKAHLIQWSGNCLPFEAAVREVRLAGAFNINGGDSRFDNEYASYAWVRPLGQNVGKELQILSSMANENLYTELWSKNFFGFNRLYKTIENTETPIRLRPINLYYHTYSGEKLASLNAVKQNIAFIKTQEIAPIKASDFSQMVMGFYSTEIYQTAPNTWKFANRGALQTIRFDKATFQAVDFSQSKGIVGQRHSQGNLYVYLDKSVETPLIAIKSIDESHKEPVADTPYLVESRWTVENLKKEGNKQWSFNAQGYGDGAMTWSVPIEGNYRITSGNKTMTEKSKEHLLKYTVKDSAIKPINVTIELIDK